MEDAFTTKYGMALLFAASALASTLACILLSLFVHAYIGMGFVSFGLYGCIFAFLFPSWKGACEYKRLVLGLYGMGALIFMILILCTTNLTPPVEWIASAAGIFTATSFGQVWYSIWKSSSQMKREIAIDATQQAEELSGALNDRTSAVKQRTAKESDDEIKPASAEGIEGEKDKFIQEATTNQEKRKSTLRIILEDEKARIVIDYLHILCFLLCVAMVGVCFNSEQTSPIIYPDLVCGQLNTTLSAVPQMAAAFERCRDATFETKQNAENLNFTLDLGYGQKEANTKTVTVILTEPTVVQYNITLRCNHRLVNFYQVITFVSPPDLLGACKHLTPGNPFPQVSSSEDPSAEVSLAISPWILFFVALFVTFCFHLLMYKWYWNLHAWNLRRIENLQAPILRSIHVDGPDPNPFFSLDDSFTSPSATLPLPTSSL
eukprot:TRINITY_DN14999_c0_g1_i1.p1 TRINITY_DN14999_c0_g1~~TRINITY_DN14999_c0_g1_i1.p1  ORF type:complete len:458 (+),score=64.94 TRINITY_DN14999_c0_g1_i1:73-1374(+)